MRIFRLLFAPLRLLFSLLRLPFRLWARRRILAKHGWVELHLEGEVVEVRPPVSRARALYRRFMRVDEPKVVVLSRLRRFVEELLADPNAKGVLVRIGPLGGGWASADAIRAQLERIKAKKLPIFAHVASYAGNRELLAISPASKLYMTPSGGLAAVGSAAVGLFLKGVLDRVGVRVEVAARGRYKSAPEQLTRSDRSSFDHEQNKALVDAFDDKLLTGVSTLYGVDRAGAEALVDRSPMVGTTALEAGFCHGLAHDEDVIDAVEKLAGLPPIDLAASEKKRRPRLRTVGAGDYLAVRRARPIFGQRGRSVGIVEVHGAIVDRAPSFSTGGRAAVEGAVVSDLRLALADPKIAAVILHVNSRGGSVFASDGIYAAVRRLDKEKPVIACFGDVSASGGYYVACGARAIVASPMTVTGSIGVFAMLPTWPELAKKADIGHDVIKNRKNAALYDPWGTFTDEERAHADHEVGAMYESFLALVAEARKKSRDEVHAVAEGRVWTGEAAKSAGLIDGLGGIEEAIERAKTAAKGRIRDETVLITARHPMPRPAPFSPKPDASIAALLDLAASALGVDEPARQILAELIVLASSSKAPARLRTLCWAPIP